MRSLVWKRLGSADLPALEAYLRSREAEAAGFIGRILKGGRLKVPQPFMMTLAILVERSLEPGERRVEGAILKSDTGLVFPLLPAFRPKGPREGLPGSLAEGLVSTIGPQSDVERFEAAFGLKPLVRVDYDFMARASTPCPIPAWPGPEALTLGRAGPGDLEGLLGLQSAYEVEEVLTPIHRFDLGATKAGLGRSLRDQIVYQARLDGQAVAKAATNAQSFTLDQLGGIFVAPPYRRRGLGRLLVASLVDALAARGRASVLFVKCRNEAARGLYEDLGFSVQGAYRADYFSA